jgi:hypothetical protein
MAKDDQAMPALAAGRIKFKLHAPAPGQATQLAQQFIAGHGRWMAIDQNGVKAAPPAGRDGHRD